MYSYESLRWQSQSFALSLAAALVAGCSYSGDGLSVPSGTPEAGTGRDRDVGATKIDAGNRPEADAAVGEEEVDDAGAATPDGADRTDAISDAGARTDSADQTDAIFDASSRPDGADGAVLDPDTHWRFAVLGDSRGTTRGYNRAVFPRLLEAILDEHERFAIDLMLFPGDLIINSVDVLVDLASWAEATRPVHEAGIAIYPVRGNHEIGCDSSCWNRVFYGSRALPRNGPPGQEGLTYSFLHKNAFFVGFDNYVDKPVDVDWIQEKLDGNIRPHIFTFSHQPAFAAYHLDCLDDFPEERDRFWAALKRAGSRVYFCGHDHLYDHARVFDGDGERKNDIHQFIVGTGGGPLHTFSPPYPGDNSGMKVGQIDHAETYGYLLVEIDDLTATLTWMALETGAGSSWSY